MVSILGSPVTKPCSGWGIHEKVTASLCDVLLNLNRPADSRERMKALLMGLQNSICSGLEALDGEGRFAEESWVRPEGGGGRSRVMKEGRVFEQGGVNFSEVEGINLPPSILSQRPEAEGEPWFATGTSMVLHPRNPYVPTVHLNYRYFEAGPVWWFGGGADLTPYYPFLEDAKHFHRCLKAACDSVNPAYFPVFKPWCDEYFYLKHRAETRGIGGIFYDYQEPGAALYRGQNPDGAAAQLGAGLVPERSWEDLFELASACGNAFLNSYCPIVERRNGLDYGERERQFQLYRRGRYVEFNLVFDRGTIFGLQTNGRTESILMSLPPLVRWEYGYQVEPGSREALLTDLFTKPQDWLADGSLLERCTASGAVG
ncbi:MAG: oxygen-dependent coproporphyrinogen oxidase [Synechococcus lacustris]|jgi:coproporphyrinogen III oxidase|nr:oxygen-dependent coproporphyrinogen oxidase [Synechococcus lacustris]MCP9794054.1 oxygen-dependent coproporphyrinogen oxidase [Synechococcus lacustris L1F-Slac]MCP9810785.1 oxygen-dependent coproporphyrinogen oxidase [Synechococcus lacustris Maggiore-St4-Slac]MCP9813073.1 oxygen-dependent coproporphyrinogen oxidase [Synechococcus lacustris L1E-Slac]MCP9923916.1 oxygen-dependent coproporphyrinogen oxidase [Synechococcus lacustris C3-12m-Tous]